MIIDFDELDGIAIGFGSAFVDSSAEAAVEISDSEGIEYTARLNRLHATARLNKLHATARTGRLHFTARENHE